MKLQINLSANDFFQDPFINKQVQLHLKIVSITCLSPCALNLDCKVSWVVVYRLVHGYCGSLQHLDLVSKLESCRKCQGRFLFIYWASYKCCQPTRSYKQMHSLENHSFPAASSNTFSNIASMLLPVKALVSK